jgi:hypothetical protein
MPEIAELAVTYAVAAMIKAVACAVMLEPSPRPRPAEVLMLGSGEVIVMAVLEGGLTGGGEHRVRRRWRGADQDRPPVFRASTADAVAPVLSGRTATW